MTDPSLRRVLDIPPLALRTVAVDFDGVIHRYGQGIHDGTCYDVPMPGALESLRELSAVRPVAVLTARPLGLVWEWFDRHAPSFPLYPDHGLHREWWDQLGTLLLTNRKIVAQHYVDDRALRFAAGRDDDGEEWAATLRRIAGWDEYYRARYAALAAEAEPCG
jgi:hypothetical protein